MSHLPLSDSELIYRVRDESAPRTVRNEALSELTERHSGIYVKIAAQYAGFSNKVNVDELKDDKAFNIYQWIIKYDETRGMKLSTFIGEMVKYECLDRLAKTPDQVPLEVVPETPVDGKALTDTPIETVDDLEQRVGLVPDPDFWPIFKARHLADKPATWREIGRQRGMTHEWARQIYHRYLPRVQAKVTL